MQAKCNQKPMHTSRLARPISLACNPAMANFTPIVLERKRLQCQIIFQLLVR